MKYTVGLFALLALVIMSGCNLPTRNTATVDVDADTADTTPTATIPDIKAQIKARNEDADVDADADDDAMNETGGVVIVDTEGAVTGSAE